MAAINQVEQIISNALNTANAQVANGGGYTNTAMGVADRYLVDPYIIPDLVDPFSVSAVPNFAPDEDLSQLFQADYDSALAQYLDLMGQKLGSFLADWFPDFTGDMRLAEEWLAKAIRDGGTGLNPTVENAIWERSRARELAEAHRMEQEAIAAVAARGFFLPTGVLAARLQEVQQAASDKISTHARDVAIKAFEAELENVKFAVEQQLSHRVKVLQAAGEYMKTWMLAPQTAVDRAKNVVLTRNELWRAAAAYYETLIRADQTRLEYIKLKAGSNENELTRTTRMTLEALDKKVAAAIAGVNQAASAASAALSSLNSMAQVANVTQE